jgi:stearoyl-CoA desaturase (Delta-9 desaturase)
VSSAPPTQAPPEAGKTPDTPPRGPGQVPETYPASLLYRVFTGLFVFGPPALLAATLRRRWLMATPANRRIFAISYMLSGFGITAGYHRLFTHRSFKTYPVIRGVFAVLGSTAIQGSVPDWVADHRKHHAYADEEGDPHSPHAGHEGGVLRGFVHAHFGWLFADEKASRQRYVPDLLEDPVVMAVHRRFAHIVVLSYFVAPFAAGLLATRKLRGGLGGFLWGGAMRVFFVHHATWSVNSVCHLWGKRPFETRDESRNNPLVAMVGLGEGNHHNHHAFPRSAKHGLEKWQFDPTWWLIATMEKTGLAWDVQRVDPAEMERKRVRASVAAADSTDTSV